MSFEDFSPAGLARFIQQGEWDLVTAKDAGLTDEQIKRLEPLARSLAAATLAQMTGEKSSVVHKRFKDEPVGDLWTMLAAVATKWVANALRFEGAETL